MESPTFPGRFRLLIEVVARIGSCIRACDTAARRGGDEFAIVLDGCDEKRAGALGARIRTTISMPFIHGGAVIHPSGSLGVALAGPAGDFSSLLRAADAAMYRAKVRHQRRVGA